MERQRGDADQGLDPGIGREQVAPARLARLASQAPSAMPPMKAASTKDCAKAAEPRKSLR